MEFINFIFEFLWVMWWLGLDDVEYVLFIVINIFLVDWFNV